MNILNLLEIATYFEQYREHTGSKYYKESYAKISGENKKIQRLVGGWISSNCYFFFFYFLQNILIFQELSL